MSLSKEGLNDILEKHRKWLVGDTDGEMLFSFSSLDFRGADLKGTDLSKACIHNADLRGADLRDADLICAELESADLRGADLRRADLRCAYLIGVDLRSANLSEANLEWANLSYANLIDANLTGANLRHTNLDNVSIKPDVLDAVLPTVCPKNGAFIGWKMIINQNGRPLIAKLMIPENARRTSSSSNKCRCDRAVCLELQNIDGTISEETWAKSWWDDAFVYAVGEGVYADDFNDDRRFSCGRGIHFFMNRDKAVDFCRRIFDQKA